MDLTDATPADMVAELNARGAEFILLVNEKGKCRAYSSPVKDSGDDVFTQVRDFMIQLKVQDLADWESK